MQQFRQIRHDQCLVLLYYFHKKIMQKKSEIFEKPNFLGQTPDFLPTRKPGLYLSRVNFFSFEYNEYRSQHYNQWLDFMLVIEFCNM